MTRESITAVVKPKMDISEEYLKQWYSDLLSGPVAEGCLGRFKRLRTGDSGNELRFSIQALC